MSDIKVTVTKVWLAEDGSLYATVKLPAGAEPFMCLDTLSVSLNEPVEYNESRSFGDASVIRHPIPRDLPEDWPPPVRPEKPGDFSG